MNSGNEDSKNVKSSKNKKKNCRRKDRPKDPSSNIANRNHNKEIDSLSSSHNSKIEDLFGSASPEFDFDDDLDPVLMEELDREVEEFAQRLNSVWLDRVQGIISFGQDRSITTLSMNLSHMQQRLSFGLDHTRDAKYFSYAAVIFFSERTLVGEEKNI